MDEKGIRAQFRDCLQRNGPKANDEQDQDDILASPSPSQHPAFDIDGFEDVTSEDFLGDYLDCILDDTQNGDDVD